MYEEKKKNKWRRRFVKETSWLWSAGNPCKKPFVWVQACNLSGGLAASGDSLSEDGGGGKQSQVNVSPIFTLTIALYTRPLAANCSIEHKVYCCLWSTLSETLRRWFSYRRTFHVSYLLNMIFLLPSGLYLRPTKASIFTYKCNIHNWCLILSANKHSLWRPIKHMVI